MDESKQPGIEFVRIFLFDLKYKWNDKFKPAGKPAGYDIRPEYVAKISQDKKTLEAHLTMSISSKPLKLSAHLVGLFRVAPEANMDIEDFANLQALALMYPFAREVVFNVTSRSPISGLVLPPVNLKALLEQHVQQRKQSPKKNSGTNKPRVQSARKK
jgi:preprotein translocase subunit SecB